MDEADLEFLRMAHDDFQGLWAFIRAVEINYPDADVLSVRNSVLRVLKRLLDDGLIEAGDLERDGRTFMPWRVQPDVVLSNIEEQWSGLGRSPNIGEIAWFVTTPKGDDVVRATAQPRDHPHPG